MTKETLRETPRENKYWQIITIRKLLLYMVVITEVILQQQQ
jgi:hypothetical protein